MTAVEIYLKIHITVFCFIHAKTLTSYQKKQIEILTGNDKLLNNFRYSSKAKYGHNSIQLIDDLGQLMENSPDKLTALKSAVARLSGREWVSKRYDTESITDKTEEIENIFKSFQEFTAWMQTENLDILGKLEISS